MHSMHSMHSMHGIWLFSGTDISIYVTEKTISPGLIIIVAPLFSWYLAGLSGLMGPIVANCVCANPQILLTPGQSAHSSMWGIHIQKHYIFTRRNPYYSSLSPSPTTHPPTHPHTHTHIHTHTDHHHHQDSKTIGHTYGNKSLGSELMSVIWYPCIEIRLLEQYLHFYNPFYISRKLLHYDLTSGCIMEAEI